MKVHLAEGVKNEPIRHLHFISRRWHAWHVRIIKLESCIHFISRKHLGDFGDADSIIIKVLLSKSTTYFLLLNFKMCIQQRTTEVGTAGWYSKYCKFTWRGRQELLSGIGLKVGCRGKQEAPL
jgi:hypothetical protein